MRPNAFLDFLHLKGLSSMGNRIQSPAPASFGAPPTKPLPQIATTSGVSIDELVGVGAELRLVKRNVESHT